MADTQSLLGRHILALAASGIARSASGDERFRMLAEHAPIGIFHIDLVACQIYRNGVLAGLLGVDSFEPISESAVHLDLIHPDDRDRFVREAGQAIATGKPLETEVRYLAPDGRVVWALERSVPELDAEGNVLGWIGTLFDITERKQLEERAQRERQLILHIGKGLGTAPSERFFDVLCSELVQALAVDVVFIREFRHAPRAHFGDVAGLVRGEPMPPHSYLVPAAEIPLMEDARPLLIPDLVASGRSGRHLFSRDMQVLVAYPLRAADQRLLGYMGVMHSRSLDLALAGRLVEIFSQRAATELERERSQRVLAEQRANLRWINTLSIRLHGCDDLAEIGRVTVEAVSSHGSAPRVTVALGEGEGARPIRVLASSGGEAPGGSHFPRVGLIFDRLYANDGVLVVEELAATFPDLPLYRSWISRYGVVEQALVLLHHGGRELGLLVLDYTEHGRARQLDIESLRALGRTLALAISNARHIADLEYRATHDALTGLYSRNVLHHTFPARAGDSAVLLLLDLDRFKEINDTLGHAVGDRLLRHIGPRLRAVLGERPQLLCRMGGDEFTLLLPGVAAEEARLIAQRLLVALQQPFVVDGMRLQIGASIGIAGYPAHGADSHALLRSADVAMYAAKHGGGGVAIYDADLDLHTPQRLALIGDLADAIRDGQLCLHYQPKIELGSGRVCGFEALVRWQHPRFGLLAPGAFLPLAEMSDTIHLLTAEVLRLASADLVRWRAQGRLHSVAVNLSARNLIDDQCAEQVRQLVAEHALPAGALELEITETALMQDPERAAALLQRIAATGVNLAIDDFGTGYSSLAYLRRLPITALKIDRTFVRDMAENHHDAVIVQSTIQLAHNLGLEVVAEGVEDEAALQMLRGMGCDKVQGYHLSRPLPRDQLEAWLGCAADLRR